MSNSNSLFLKSLNYTVGIRYKNGVYLGIYNNSHLLFVDDIRYRTHTEFWSIKWPGLPKSIILSIPSKNEVNFVLNNPNIHDIFPIFAENVYNTYIINNTYIITIDDLYYRPKFNDNASTALWAVNRIY